MSVRVHDAIWYGMSRTHAIQGRRTAICLTARVAMHELAGITEVEPFNVSNRQATWQAFSSRVAPGRRHASALSRPHQLARTHSGARRIRGSAPPRGTLELMDSSRDETRPCSKSTGDLSLT